MLKHIDLFSGIGGAALAIDNVWGKGKVEHIFCDNEPFAQKVLKKHWPKSPIYSDVKDFDGKQYRGAAILTGGFPCQPFSIAGKRKGTGDDRHLWPEMLRVIREIKPQWIIGENVIGLLTWDDGLVFESICIDLEAEGYETRAFVIPACGIGAEHRRDRIWVVAHIDENKLRRFEIPEYSQDKEWVSSQNIEAGGRGLNELGSILTMPRDNSYARNRRKFYGIPAGMDRLGGLGNSWVPQIAEEILTAIREVENK